MERTTTLSEFTDDVDEDTDADAAGDDPTPASNAEDIQHLISLVGQLSETLGDLAGQLEQHENGDAPETAESIEPKPDRTTERMFH